MNERFPSLKMLNVPFYYGIDTNKFLVKDTDRIIPYKFIYSSFPNRGLLPLLQMWPQIYNKYPQATLHIYADVNGTWVNNVAPEQMREVRHLLLQQKYMNINYHGWVDKQTLADSWITADFWFYPCIFMETFCLTALEAAITKTFVISNDLAALQNTVGHRGAVIKGDASTKEWQSKALETLFYYMDERNSREKQELIQKNYEWAYGLTWKNQAQKLLSNYIKKYDVVNIQSLINNQINPNVESSQDDNIQIRFIENKKQDNNSETYNTYDNNKKLIYIDKILDNTYNLIQTELLPLTNSFGKELEGSMFDKDRINQLTYKDKNKLINLCDVLLNKNPKQILEIGFNAGFSTLLMLMTNPNINITCVDICEHKYVIPCYEVISKKFPGKVEFIKGNSEIVLPNLIKQNKRYDMIHFDGCHKVLTVFHNIHNSIKMSNENTILIIDDYNESHINVLWNMCVDYFKLEPYELIKPTEEQDIRICKNLD